MGKVINLQEYKIKTGLIESPHIVEDDGLDKWEREHAIWDHFCDDWGQYIYDQIMGGHEVDQEELHFYGVETEEEFLSTWRGNSQVEYRKWLKKQDRDWLIKFFNSEEELNLFLKKQGVKI